MTAAPSVLLVDDDPGIRRDYSKLLRRLGYATETASNGHEAVEFVQGKSFDVILSDISMPTMGGIEFLRAVKHFDHNVPVVLMTGQPELESAIEAVKYGAYRYLTKPVGMEMLSSTMREAATLREESLLRRETLRTSDIASLHPSVKEGLELRLNSALEKLWIAFQPIVNWPRREVFGYEALARSTVPLLLEPSDLIEAAERLGRVHDFGRRIRGAVVEAAAEAPADALLFINLHALDLNDDQLLAGDSRLAQMANRVVLEVTERASLDVVEELPEKISRLRELGYRIAVDDLGAGYAGLASFSQLVPEFAKLDVSLVRGLGESAKKRSVVSALIKLCTKDLSIQLVSEGIETPAERDFLAAEGCELQQGYLFSRPEPGFPAPAW